MAEKTILEPVKKWLEKSLLEPGHGPHAEGWNAIFGDPLLAGSGAVSVDHLLMTGVVCLLVIIVGLLANRKYSGPKEEAVIPEGHLSVRNFVEVIFDFALDLMEQMMDREDAKRYFPLIVTLVLVILFSNLLGLVPGFIPPTQNANTTLAMGASVFVAYNLIGFFRRGFHYVNDFLAPVSTEELTGEDPPGWQWLLGSGFWLALSVLMLGIEVIAHAFRPISLSVRLTGNMGGDHAVLGAFSTIADTFLGAPVLLPVPFLFLGLLVSVVQTMVFALLSAVYIAMAVEEGH